MSKTTFKAEPGKQEILVTRVFDAPRERVFEAHTDPRSIEQWWGPRRYATIAERLDARPGGLWRFVNRHPNGPEYAFHGVYHECRAPERIVRTFEFEGTPGQVLLETVVFDVVAGGTKVTAQSLFQSVAARDGMMTAGAEGGMVESMDRLEELVTRPAR